MLFEALAASSRTKLLRVAALALGVSIAAACGGTGLAGDPDLGASASDASDGGADGAAGNTDASDAGPSGEALDGGTAPVLDSGIGDDAGAPPSADSGVELGADAGVVDSDADDALSMTLTSYDDGRSCPGNCDAHVVFSAVHNGTANAFRPAKAEDPLAARRANLRAPCRVGEDCAICFGKAASSCIVTTYRGSGPKRGRFDVTPAFLKARCGQPGLPEALDEKCRSHMAAARRLAQRVSCIERPSHPSCVEVMRAAVAAKETDTPRYERCKELGQRAYNTSVEDPSLEREHDCAYFANRRHPTGGWLLLTPGACRDGYFVGKSGLDCCSADPVQAAIDPVECGQFYQ